MKKDVVTFEITKKDKVYLSIIFGLVIALICMAICLPRPYKVIEKEVPVYETKVKEVYNTKQIYLISSSNSLYDQSKGYYEDLEGNKYVASFSNLYLNVGEVINAKVIIVIDNSGIKERKEVVLQTSYTDLLVDDSNGFGQIVSVNSYLMTNIKSLLESQFGNMNIKEDYLFEISFENAKISLLVSYISK